MKKGIHPEYRECQVVCLCGSGHSWTTRATVSEIRTEVCSHCHSFYTGQQRLMDSAGRVEQFRRKYAKFDQKNQSTATPAKRK